MNHVIDSLLTVSLLSFSQYDTDFYILDKYPLAVRPFYTMPDPQDPVSGIYWLYCIERHVWFFSIAQKWT